MWGVFVFYLGRFAMSGQVRVILEQDGLKVTRDPAFIDDDRKCEHQLAREGGFQNPGVVVRAVRAVEGVNHAYISRTQGVASIFYGLVTDKPEQYVPLAREVIGAVKAVL